MPTTANNLNYNLLWWSNGRCHLHSWKFLIAFINKWYIFNSTHYHRLVTFSLWIVKVLFLFISFLTVLQRLFLFRKVNPHFRLCLCRCTSGYTYSKQFSCDGARMVLRQSAERMGWKSALTSSNSPIPCIFCADPIFKPKQLALVPEGHFRVSGCETCQSVHMQTNALFARHYSFQYFICSL